MGSRDLEGEGDFGRGNRPGVRQRRIDAEDRRRKGMEPSSSTLFSSHRTPAIDLHCDFCTPPFCRCLTTSVTTSQVFKLVSYHVDLQPKHMELMIKYLKKYSPDRQPLWTQIGVARLAYDSMHVEIDVVAYDPK
jgi:hypothetical protein